MMYELRRMMKKVLVITLLCIGCILRGQEAAEKEEGPKEGWLTGGTFTFLFNQTAFKNWLAGGQNSIGGNVSANYDLRYLRETGIGTINSSSPTALQKQRVLTLEKQTIGSSSVHC